jgi:phthiocerol/phenolphthiocerol synthesis type-I polyketide synthase C
MKKLLDTIRSEMPPLTTVFHAAVVYADELVMRMTPEQFAKATRPKMLGGWNLHQLTMEDPITNFVLFSSISTVLATPTQASYVAANCIPRSA